MHRAAPLQPNEELSRLRDLRMASLYRRENRGNRRLTYTQQKPCTYINFLIPVTTYKVLSSIFFYYPSFVASVSMLILLDTGNCAFSSSSMFYCQKEFESLLTYLHLPTSAPDPNPRGQQIYDIHILSTTHHLI